MLIIKNARIYTMDSAGVADGADVRIENGKIAEIGHGLVCDGAEVIDAAGLCVTPGLIDGHTHAGGSFMAPHPDLNEMTDPITPHMDALYAIDIHEASVLALPQTGTTACCFIPGSGNVICGTGFVAKTAGGRSLRDRLVLNPAVMKCALGGNPKNVYGSRDQTPGTRMGVAALFREAMERAVRYRNRKLAGETPEHDAKSEALIPVLEGTIPLKIHCEQYDILTAIAIAREFGCRYTIEHAWGCGPYMEEMVQGGGHIMFGPIGIAEGFGELVGGDVALAVELQRRGLGVSLITDGPICGPEILLLSAGEAVRCGAEHLDALAMITSNPARGLEVFDRIGSITPGKDADLVLWQGVPALDMDARVRTTIIGGEVVYSAGE